MSVHDESACAGEACVIHNPSDHHMADWPVSVRYDRWALAERICPHGIGHPDPDSLAWQRRMVEQGKISAGAYSDTHGCDGCCAP